MNDRFFLDTNILVYSFDQSQPVKRDASREIISKALSAGNGMVSFQVVQEFLNVATGKFKKILTLSDIRAYLDEVLLPLCEIFPSNDFYRDSLEIKERTGFSFYDSMVVQAALAGNCRILYSEDMQDGFKLFDLTVKNPFKAG